jgi:hypothetical protein
MKHAKKKAAKPAAKKTKGGTKKQILIDLLSKPGGSTLAEMTKAVGWEKENSTRGAVSSLGAESFVDGETRRYRLPKGTAK